MGTARYRGTTRARRPERRRRPHRVKWKPVYARLSSRVNPDHSSIAPQTGDPRDLSSPSTGSDATAPLRFLALRPGNQFQRSHLLRSARLKSMVLRERTSTTPLFFLPPHPARLSRCENDATKILSWVKWTRRKGEVVGEGPVSSRPFFRFLGDQNHVLSSLALFLSPLPLSLCLSPSFSLSRCFTTDDRQSIKA